MVRKTSNSSKHKGKKYQVKEEDSTSMHETSYYDDWKPKKGKVVCSYCNKPNHGEDVWMKKQLARCISILDKYNLKFLIMSGTSNQLRILKSHLMKRNARRWATPCLQQLFHLLLHMKRGENNLHNMLSSSSTSSSFERGFFP